MVFIWIICYVRTGTSRSPVFSFPESSTGLTTLSKYSTKQHITNQPRTGPDVSSRVGMDRGSRVDGGWAGSGRLGTCYRVGRAVLAPARRAVTVG